MKAQNIINRDQSDIYQELDIHKLQLIKQNNELLFTQGKLIVSLEEYAQLFNLAPLSYFVLDRDGVVLDLNFTAHQLLGTEKKNILGKNFSLYLNGNTEREDYYKHRNYVIKTEKPHKIECEIIRKDGKIHPILMESTIVKNNNNKFKYFLSTIVDISNRKEHEKQLEISLHKEKELNELKSRFVSTASHEFRTPLSSILSSADIIKKHLENNDPDKCQKHIYRIKESVLILTEILNEFLSLDRLENGKRNPIEENTNLRKLAKNTIDEAKLAIKEGQKIKYIHVGDSKFILDAKIFHSVVLNLLSNASKYSSKKKTIELKIIVSKEKVNIEVKDQGIGIPDDDQKKIFSRLFRAKNVDAIGGTGLGLNILKKYIELHNGKISFESKEHIGSTFFVEIPLGGNT